jgi:hypothetical protein
MGQKSSSNMTIDRDAYRICKLISSAIGKLARLPAIQVA